MPLEIAEAEAWAQDLFDKFAINEKYLEEDFSDGYLDMRDSDPFDSNWVEADKWLEKQAKERLSKEEMEQLEAVKEKWRIKFFDKIIRTTHSSDLAAYLSEDIELVLGSKMMSARNDFLEEVANALESGRLPGQSQV